MKLENQVCSLDLAKRLKELGVKQESLFWWVWGHNVQRELNYGRIEDDNFAAFTVAELGEMLPCFFKTEENGYVNLVIRKMADNDWHIEYVSYKEVIYKITEVVTEADARAKMLIYLKENNLVSV
jgi:hypothetical protein